MLTQYDIQCMEKDVMNILTSWTMRIQILKPLPKDQQQNWSNIMNEYTGDVSYDKLLDVPAERKDMVNLYNDHIKDDIAGDRIEGSILIAVPIIFNGKPLIIEPFDIFILDDTGDQYHIYSIRDRIGETLVWLKRYAGGNDSGIRGDSENVQG